MKTDIKCDFCSGQPVTARYHARDFVARAFSVGELQQGSTGDWAACHDCELLIDANDWISLVDRVIEKFFENHPEMKDIIEPDSLREQLFDLYAQLMQSDFKKGKLDA